MLSLRSAFGLCFVFLLCIQTAFSLYCYTCVSNQPGCGKELSIRTQRWRYCPDPGPFGGENFCVKVIENINSNVVITRECLMNLRHSERHREKLPTVQRHNFCKPGRNNDPNKPYDMDMVFCYCNDKDGCNTSSRSLSSPITLLLVITTTLLVWFNL